MSHSTERLALALADRYKIERQLGQGGMATVYLAEDLKHKRHVAVKVLKPELAAVLGAERFVQEITTTAALQHPHILPLFDSGTADGFLFYVMPYIEGETLRGRLDREKQLGVDEAVRITREVADALDYAHRHNVIHRDIKPENILLHDGRPMVADFGIALAVSAAAGGRMTETGLSLGTPHYMSPEQATAEKDITGRSDVYSLGSVLYEMLAGDPPHTGSTAQQIIMKIITEQAQPVTALRKAVPAHVAAAVARAIEKLPADRFESAKAFSEALGNTAFTSTATSARAGASAADRGQWKRIATALGASTLVLAATAAVGWMRDTPPGLVRRFYVTMSDALPDFGGVLVSPDGRLLVYLDAEGRLRARGVDELASTPIPGTDNAWASTFSPDSREIVLSTGFPGALKIVPLSGGAIRTLVADSTYGTGLAWSDDGWIYFLKGADYGRDLMRIRATGGDAEFVARPDSAAGALFFYWPEALPGGKKLLLTILGYSGESQVGVLDVRSGSVTGLAAGTMARYVASGHLAVVKADGTLQAAPFDAGSGRVTGAFVTVERGVARYSFTSHMFSVSQEGTQVFQVEAPPGELVRVARDGSERPLDANWKGNFVNPSLSPDGSRLAVGTLSGGRTELWVRELRTGVLTRLAAGGTLNYRPFWSPDGRDVMFTSDQRGKIGIYRVPADGSAPAVRHVVVRPSVDEAALSRDGRWLVLRTGSGGGRDLVAMRTGGDSALVPLVTSAAEEFSPALSPDGRWLAYGSDETGRTEVYVRPFPSAAGAKSVVSRGGGSEPQWSPVGGELFYRDGAGNLVAVAIAPGSEFRAASSQILFSARAYGEDNRHHSYAVAPDGRSFVFARSVISTQAPQQMVVTLNWFEELKRSVRP